jgi:hypothetical protein
VAQRGWQRWFGQGAGVLLWLWSSACSIDDRPTHILDARPGESSAGAGGTDRRDVSVVEAAPEQPAPVQSGAGSAAPPEPSGPSGPSGQSGVARDAGAEDPARAQPVLPSSPPAAVVELHDVEVTAGGSGFGRVRSDPPGIDCSSPPCRAAFPSGTRVTLQAWTPESGGFGFRVGPGPAPGSTAVS